MSKAAQENVKTEAAAEELVDELIRAARDVEFEAHFGSRWDFVRNEMLEARAKVLAAMAGAEG